MSDSTPRSPRDTLGVVFLPSTAPEQLEGVARRGRSVRASRDLAVGGLLQGERCRAGRGAAGLDLTRRVGIGLLPVPLRNVAATAMEVATLHGSSRAG